MMFSIPKVRWVKLADPQLDPEDQIAPEMEGVEIGCRLMKPEEHDNWVLKQSANQVAEAKRKLDARKGLTPEMSPEIFSADYQTTEGMKASLALARDYVNAAAVAVRGVVEISEGESPEPLISAMSLSSRIKLFAQLMSQQSPGRAESPAAEVPVEV